ncbi:hypothetical protein MYIN104542_29535 [Mycobacterium intermedium]
MLLLPVLPNPTLLSPTLPNPMLLLPTLPNPTLNTCGPGGGAMLMKPPERLLPTL